MDDKETMTYGAPSGAASMLFTTNSFFIYQIKNSCHIILFFIIIPYYLPRLVDLKKGLIGIHAEVEVSRDYLQHLVSQRTPVIYEIEEILKRYQIDYNIWHDKIKKNVQTILDNYNVKLSSPSLPVFAWKPMLFVIGTISMFYLWKYINTI